MPEKRTSGSFPEDSAAAEKKRRRQNIGEPDSVRMRQGAAPYPPGISPVRGTVPAVDGSYSLSGACRFRGCNARCFSEEDSVQRSSRRTASPPSKMIAEESAGGVFMSASRVPSLNLLQYADGFKDQRRQLQRPCFRPWCPRVRWPARCCLWSAGRSPPARRFRETHGQGPWWLRPPRNQNEASRPG